MSSVSTTFIRRLPRPSSTTFPRPLTSTFTSYITVAHSRYTVHPTFSLLPSTKPSAAFFSTSSSKMTAGKRSAEHQNQGESTEGISEWKKRAPYRVYDKGEGFEVKYEANCHCGKVKYELSREEPLDSKLCHCTTCQVQHAAPFQWAAIFHKEDINFVSGHHDLEWYDPSSKSIEHKLPCKVRCSFCHSPIMDEGRNMILLFPSLVHLKTDEHKRKFKPRCHMFYGQRVMDVPDGLPKWSGLSGESELIEDSPPEEIRALERKRKRELEEGKKDE